MIKSAGILVVVLGAYWLALSGYLHDRVLLTMGGLSVLVTLILVWRMKILDEETAPYLHGKALAYFGWLFGEIVKANMAVVKAVMSPDMEIAPALLTVPMRHTEDLGRVSFANSITLTPGTVSVSLDAHSILVHALLKEMSDPDDFLDMEARSAWAVSDDGVDVE